jgi:hypothetical protein
MLVAKLVHVLDGLFAGNCPTFTVGKRLDRRVNELFDRPDQAGLNGLLDCFFLIWFENDGYAHTRRLL